MAGSAERSRSAILSSGLDARELQPLVDLVVGRVDRPSGVIVAPRQELQRARETGRTQQSAGPGCGGLPRRETREDRLLARPSASSGSRDEETPCACTLDRPSRAATRPAWRGQQNRGRNRSPETRAVCHSCQLPSPRAIDLDRKASRRRPRDAPGAGSPERSRRRARGRSARPASRRRPPTRRPSRKRGPNSVARSGRETNRRFDCGFVARRFCRIDVSSPASTTRPFHSVKSVV